ncbi:MAG: hypothetical protein R2873_19470 [Caldilineaceae bacterium]
MGARASGDVTVGSGAAPKASRLVVDGHVQAQGAAVVTIHNSSIVGGNVTVNGGDSATVDGVLILGDLTVEGNRRALAVTGNQVGGAVQITGNQSGLVVRSNTPSPAHFSARITAFGQSPTAIRPLPWPISVWR